MEHVTDINKKEYIDGCKAVVKDIMEDENIELTDHELTLLTEDIMDTALMMGGDYAILNIVHITKEYIRSDFLSRFKAMCNTKEDV
ncbi:MAG: hypothetical protein K2P09_00195 [Erysipelotrichales bacterium]|nr:hypothetical protein [Erysipelotrichales bacterium]